MGNVITKVETKKIKSSVPICNNWHILNWMVDQSSNNYSNGKKVLTQELSAELTSIFGIRNKSMRLERLTKIWVLKYKGLTFNVFTAKHRGTSIEICDYTDEDMRNAIKEEEIIEFLIELNNLINN